MGRSRALVAILLSHKSWGHDDDGGKLFLYTPPFSLSFEEIGESTG